MSDHINDAYQDYVAGMKYKDIAAKYDVSIDTVKSWRRRHGWTRDKPKTDAFKNKKGAHKTKEAHTKTEKGAPKIIQGAVDELSDNDELTEKQKFFCLYYLQRFNATWAYQQAYGRSYEVAMTNGSRMLRNARIRETIGNLKKQQQAELFITATDILKEYIKQATSSLGDVLEYTTHDIYLETENGDPIVDKEGNPVEYQRINLKLKPEDEIDWSTIQDIHLGRDGLVVKLYDKQKAMKELIDRLPEPEIEDVKQDSFLKAIMSAEDKKDGESD